MECEKECNNFVTCRFADEGKTKARCMFFIQKQKDISQDVNKGHFHEIADRCHVVLSNIDDHILEHPGMTSEMTKLCKDAQANLHAVMNLSWGERDRLFPDKN